MSEFKLPYSVLKILAEDEAVDTVENDIEHNKYNIVSICTFPKPTFRRAKSVCQRIFHDIQREEKGLILCNKWHLETILDYARTKYDEAMLVHCHAGISRSSAVTYLILLDWLKSNNHENPVEEALTLLIGVKDYNLIYPNKYIIGLGMHILADDAGQELEWNRIFYNSRITAKLYGK